MLRVFVIVLIVHVSASGQAVQRSYYDMDGFETDSVGSHSFTESSELGGRKENVSYYSATGKMCSRDVSDSLFFKKSYYHNISENLKAEIILDKKTQIETTTMFYPNGTKQAELSTGERERGESNARVLVLNYWDSLGHPIIVNGNGTCECVLSAKEEEPFIERGEVKNSMKVGGWKGVGKDGKAFEEQYKKGELIRGTMKDSDGTVYNYNEVSKQAEFVGGFAALAQYLGSTLKYPANARRMGIQGTVFVAFVVEKDGSLSHVRVIKSIGEECDKEALRVVKGSKNWNPALMRGKKVKMRFVLPIKFKLQ